MLGRDGGLLDSARRSRSDYHAPVTVPRRPAARLVVARLVVAVATLVLLVIACSPGTGPSGQPVGVTPPPSSTGTEPSLTPVPGGPGGPARSAVASHAPRPDTSVDGFGEIADHVPDSFPRLPDETDSDIGTPASGTYVSNVDAAAASRLIAAGLQAQGWSVDVGSPLEDGTVVLDATRPPAGCRTEVRFTPASGSIFITVLYGASCPSS